MKKYKCKKIGIGHYEYRGYELICIYDYEPDNCDIWEAVDLNTNCADFHASTKRYLKYLIDKRLDKGIADE